MPLPLCPIGVNCPGSDYPVSNFSSEANDGANFIGLAWPGGGNGHSGGSTGDDPPLGSDWKAVGCFGEVLAATQEEADALAIQLSQTCVIPTTTYTLDEETQQWTATGCFGVAFAASYEELVAMVQILEGNCPINPDWTGPKIDGEPTPIFGNETQTCLWTCPNGQVVSYTLPANTVYSPSQFQSNAEAYSIACNRVRTNHTCPPKPPQPVTPCSTPSEALPNGKAGEAYDQFITSELGDSFSVDPDMIPDWLSVTSAGEVVGTPSLDDGGLDWLFDVIITHSDGSRCVRHISIFVDEQGCPDWDTLTWDPAFISLLGSGFGAVTPDNAQGASFDVSALVVTALPGNSASCQGTAKVTYNSASCDCNLHVVITTLAGWTNCVGGITITAGPLFLTILSLDFFVLTPSDGPHDYPFTLPDTGGSDWDVHITVNAQTPFNGFPGTTLAVDIAGTLSNVI